MRLLIASSLTLSIALLAGPPDVEWLRSPKALASDKTPQSLAELRELFADPPARYRSAPLWVWNDELDWPWLREQLEEFRHAGMGGVFVHPRPGLMTEYLGKDWFDLWRRSVEFGRKLGLEVHIYDENSYPAGFAGGHVVSQAPDTVGKVLRFEVRSTAKGLPWNDSTTVAVHSAELDTGGHPRSFRRMQPGEELQEGHSAIVMRLEPTRARAWTGGFPYVDLTNPRTTQVFLETTYEAYKHHLGDEFGRSIRWAFADEPELPKGGGWNSPALPYSLRIQAEFRRRLGYNLADHLPSLFWDTGEFRQVRFDYWQLLHDLLRESYFEPMFEWCDRNNLQWTGHWWEHLWPAPWATPSDMSFYAFEHTPGIDMLIFNSRGLFTEGAHPLMLFTVKQASSVANQLGRPRVLSESYGGGGWIASMEQFKRMGDWQIVHGVNLINQHLSYATFRGARKRDWPQSFSSAAAWWPYYRMHGDHIGRASVAMASGKARNRVLILTPTTSAFLHARRSGENPEFETIRRDTAALVQVLADKQVDFDLGDEYMLEWFGSTKNNQLVVGEQSYDLVIWPKHMTNVRRQTEDLLDRFRGTVLALSGPAHYVDGRPRKKPASRRDWVRVNDLEELLTAIATRLPPRVRFDHELPGGIGFGERFLEDGSRLLFFNNAGPSAVDTVATVEGLSIEEWDTHSGAVRPYPAEPPSASDSHVSFRLRLPPAGSLLLAVRKNGLAAPQPSRSPRAEPLPSPTWKITADEPNVLVLDYCDVDVRGDRLRGVVTPTAAKAIFRAHGFEQNPWESAIQFRRSVFGRFRFDEDSGFEARFRFHARAVPNDIELAVESPELYRISVNGKDVDFANAKQWLDPHLKRTSIGRLTQAGQNEIRIVGQPFDVRMELESIYLLGSFSLAPVGKGFELAEPHPLKFGSWAKQGRPFDPASVVYGAEANLPAGTLRIELGDWCGTVAEVLLDGERVAVLGWQPWQAEAPVVAGRHTIAVRVVATPRNLFGPFHDPRPRHERVLWPGHWVLYANKPQPPGPEYDVEDYGLFEEPQLAIIR